MKQALTQINYIYYDHSFIVHKSSNNRCICTTQTHALNRSHGDEPIANRPVADRVMCDRRLGNIVLNRLLRAFGSSSIRRRYINIYYAINH